MGKRGGGNSYVSIHGTVIPCSFAALSGLAHEQGAKAEAIAKLNNRRNIYDSNSITFKYLLH